MELPEDPETAVERVLEWYEKDPGDALVGEEILTGATLEALKAIFHPDASDPFMVMSYEVEPRDVAALQAFARHRIDMDAYDYFVAAYARDENPE